MIENFQNRERLDSVRAKLNATIDAVNELSQNSKLSDGSATSPSLSFENDPDTGLYRQSDDQIGAVTDGVLRWLLSNTALTTTVPVLTPAGTASAPSHSFSADPNTGMYNAGADVLGFATNGTERVRVDSSGRVGIGIATPATTLDVNGDITITDKIVHSGNTDTAIRFPANDTVTVETGGVERLRVDSAGRVINGHTTSLAVGGSQQPEQIYGAGGNGISIGRFQNSAFGSDIRIFKSRSDTIGGFAAVQNADSLGNISFFGDDGLDVGRNGQAVSIRTFVDGTPASGSIPGRIGFFTNAVGGSSPTERVRINSEGKLLSPGGSAFVGTVATGTTLGAIIERGANANGSFVRFADGTQICWLEKVTDTTAFTARTEGGATAYFNIFEWTFPAQFSVSPACHGTFRAGTSGGVVRVFSSVSVNLVSTTICGFRLWALANDVAGFTEGSFTAIGRWF